LKHAEGKKMIAFLFQLNTGLVKDLHRSIRVQIPLAKGNILKAYGDIYFAAWKDSLDDEDDSERDANDDESRISSIQSTIEEHVLQDLMYASLHIASANMAKSIRTILEPIHSNKKNPDVDQLLYRMYGPILWRSLAAPNPLVRINASSILSVTFPLHDPNAGKIHLKEMNAKSIESLRNLLNDQDPKVRVAGCDATIKILGLYWDALCSTDIRALLNDIIMKHTSDISSVAVRVQAVHGIGMLLDAETSHGVLRPLLPTIGNLIHDSQERVRLATVRLLLKLKKLRGFKYYHVVPSNHLLARLTAEAERTKSMISPVASSLTELLSNSYFPLGAKGSEQIRRTLVFLNKNPQSAKVFYANLPYHLDLNNVSKLVVMLIKILKLSVEKETSDEQNVTTSGSTDEMDISASNTTLMAEVAETINSLWTSVCVSLTSYFSIPFSHSNICSIQ
jgi:condensin-2 complex subunit G2